MSDNLIKLKSMLRNLSKIMKVDITYLGACTGFEPAISTLKG